MGLFTALFGMAAATAVVFKAATFLFDKLSERERRRQERLIDDYNDYVYRKKREYVDTYNYYKNARYNSEIEYNNAISNYHKKLIQQKKIENEDTFNSMRNMCDTQFKEKEKLLDECKNIVSHCKENIDKQQNSYVRFKSIKATLISLDETVYKLEAYLRYMERYKNKLTSTFENYGDILEPFSMTLPKNYPYEGRLLFLKKNEFKNYGIEIDDAGYFRIDNSDYELFDKSDENSSIPFMVSIAKNGKQYLSLRKGLLKNSIGNTIGINAEVTNIFSKKIILNFMGNPYPRLILQKQDLINQYRRTPIGSNLHVYIKDYDFTLKKIFVSEKLEDSLNIAQFEYIALVQTEEERQSLYKYLKDNDLLDKDDEWRIGPIIDENNTLIGVIMQIGHIYGFKAHFEDILDGKLVLHYKGILPKENLLSFDDIFVTTNISLDCYSPNQIIKDPNQYENYFEECQKFRLYLINEFAIQSSIMVNSPMNVYLNQWAEITNRLVELLNYGKNIKVSILEWKYFSIKNTGTYTILYVDNPEKILQFIEKETKKKRYKFFIEVTEKEKTKFPCKLIEENNEQFVIRINGHIDVKTLINNNFILDMYSVSNPYAEKQHANAFSMFKEGRVANENIKTAIINTSKLNYQDNGYRITNLYNPKIQTNPNQLDAVIRAFAEDKFFLIQGPPGTGKTTVIKELILQQLKRNPSSCILIVSQANVAVDNVLRGIADISKTLKYIEEAQIVRCGTKDKIASDVETFSFENKYEQYKNRLNNEKPNDKKTYELRKIWLNLINDKNNDNKDMVSECLLNCYQIIGATCVGLENRHYGLNNKKFDIVIIDEAGKALPGELLIPINHAQKVVIIGDHKQLPPVINTALYKGGKIEYDDIVEEQQQLDFLNRSFFQRLYEDCPDNLKCMLDVQFRMPPIIAELVNIFYDGKLKTGTNCLKKSPILCGNHLIFIDMKDEPDYIESDKKNDGSNSSPFNIKEVEAAVNIVKKIRKYYSKRIVIITPYKRQKFELINGFNGFKNICINTIDAFQGDEEDIVIYCTTRANKPTKYFSDAARLNVAFSRTKNTLIFLGSSRYLKKYPNGHILRKINDYLSNNARIIQYNEWNSENFNLQFNPIKENISKSSNTSNIATLDLLTISSKIFDKLNNKQIYTKQVCCSCGKELNDNENILCNNCITKYEKHKCKCCGNTIYLSYFDKYIHGKSPSDLCENCSIAICSKCKNEFYIPNKKKDTLISNNKPLLCPKCYNESNEEISIGNCYVCGKPIRIKKYILEKYPNIVNTKIHKECSNLVYKKLTCIKCFSTFSITYGEKQYFENKGLSLPKKCKNCRKNNC